MSDQAMRRRAAWLLVLAALGPAMLYGQTPARVSVSSAGVQGNDDSRFPAISADGRHVAFSSYADNLVPGDTNQHVDVFVHDRLTGQIDRVSLNAAGEQANDWSSYPSISGDGRYVAFASLADNLVAGDTNATYDIFVYDRHTAEIAQVSVHSSGTQANGYCRYPSISGDGRYVAFESAATNLVDDDTNGKLDIFVHDRITGQTSCASVSSTGGQGDGDSRNASISANGQYVAYESVSTNLVDGDTNNVSDVFLRDRIAGSTLRVSVSAAGAQGDAASYAPSVCGTGPAVAFASAATNLVALDTNNWPDIFVRDLSAESTTRVSISGTSAQADDRSFTCSISADGRYVAFDSSATNLVPGDTNSRVDIFVHDRLTGQTARVSRAAGPEAGDHSQNPVIAAGGSAVSYDSFAANLVPDDTNGKVDVFASDLCCLGADLDSNGHVDADDVALFEACASGPGVALTDPACRQADQDNDGDVDQADFGLLQRCYSE